jgi:hypothetical protein
MKYIFRFSWIVFLTGIAFQFLHFPSGRFLLFSACVFLWIHGMWHLWKNHRENLHESLLYLAVAAITTYIMCRLQFWSWAKVVYYVAWLITVSWLILHLKRKIPFQWPQYLLVIYFVLLYLLAYTPSYKIYYLVRLNTTLNGETRDVDYRSWDKYSWFLYLRDKQEEALDANNKAREAVKSSIENTRDSDAASFATAIELHELQIREKKWESYP